MKYKILLVISVLAGIIAFSAPKVSAASTTFTWTGRACNNLNNCVFSTAGNWDLNAAPAAGDNLVFDNTNINADVQILDDTPNTVFGNVTFQGNKNTAFAIFGCPNSGSCGGYNGNIKINGNVSDSIVSADNLLVSGFYGNFFNTATSPTYTINDSFNFGWGGVGGDLTHATSSTAMFGDSPTFTGSGATTNIINYSAITNFTSNTAPTITLNLTSNGDFHQLAASANFSGSINVSSGTLLIAPFNAPATMPDMFSAASMLTVASGAGIVFQDPSATNTSVAEPITLAGDGTQNCTNAGTPVNCGALYADIDPNSTLTFTGNVTLTANTQINTQGSIKLTGSINGAFSFTQPYIGNLIISASTNNSNTPNGTLTGAAPTGTGGGGGTGTGSGGGTGTTGTSGSTTTTAAPGTPNTGLGFTSINPTSTLFGSLICLVSMIMFVDIYKSMNKKNIYAGVRK